MARGVYELFEDISIAIIPHYQRSSCNLPQAILQNQWSAIATRFDWPGHGYPFDCVAKKICSEAMWPPAVGGQPCSPASNLKPRTRLMIFSFDSAGSLTNHDNFWSSLSSAGFEVHAFNRLSSRGRQSTMRTTRHGQQRFWDTQLNEYPSAATTQRLDSVRSMLASIAGGKLTAHASTGPDVVTRA